MMINQDIRKIVNGRHREILISSGIIESVLNGKHQPCPLCGGKDRFRYDNKDNSGSYICSQCGSGDWVNLIMNHLGMGFKETAAYIRQNFLGENKVEQYKTKEQMKDEQNRALNARFLDDISATTLKLSADDPVTRYLNNRGITSIPPTIRFLPAYKQGGVSYPCLIARLDDEQCSRVSYKIIYLTEDGKKADVPVVKKTLPCERDMRGSSVKLFKHSGTLAVCEGIETALAYHQDTKIAAWPLDNASNLTQFNCPADVKKLIIVADMDANFTGQAAAYALAKKASALVGKDGYQLESVTVNLLLKSESYCEAFLDNGVKCDYLDYALEQIERPL